MQVLPSQFRQAKKVAVVMTLAPMMFLAGCGKTAAPKQSLPPLAVQVQTVQLSKIPMGDTFLGMVTPYIQTTLSPGTSGNLAEVDVRPGQVVHQGQVLGKLSDTVTVPASNAAQQADAALSNAQVQYQDALAMYNDHLSADQQIASVQSQVNQQQAALKTAQVSLQKAQLQAQAALGQGATPEDTAAQKTEVDFDTQALASAQKGLVTAQSNEQLSKTALDTAQQSYGQITQADVTQAAQSYQQELSFYQSWQQGGYAGSNPYYSAMTAAQAAYQGLSGGYNTLQGAQQTYNNAVQAVAGSTTAVAQAQATLAQAQKALADANPAAGSNAAQQAQLMVTTAQASLNQAQVGYDAGVASLKLTQRMAADRTQAQQSLDQASNALRQDQVNYQTAQTSLQVQIQNGQVISPISGVVQSVGAQVGQSVGPQTPLITIASNNPVMATVEVPPSDIAKVKKGAEINVYIPNSGKTYTGHILAIHPQLDATTNQYPVDVIMDGEHPELLPGLQVEGQLTNSTGKPAILVPADAVLSLQSGAEEVFVLSGNKVHSRIVQVSSMTSTQYEITGGLSVGDQLVVQGQNLLSDGDTVKVVSSARIKGN